MTLRDEAVHRTGSLIGFAIYFPILIKPRQGNYAVVLGFDLV